MPIPNSILDLDTSEALNSPAGSDAVGGTLDNYLRSHAAIIKRQFVKGANINSAATTTIPPEGAYFQIEAVTSTISGFSDNFDGRIVTLRFPAGITLAHSSALVLPGGQDIVTRAGDTGQFVNESAGVWRCLDYRGGAFGQWVSKLIGEVFALQTDLDGVALPPNDSQDFRYIVLTASDSYNDGALTDEAVSGSAPVIVATAVIDYPASPMHGETVRLINTERRFLRAGAAGTVQDSANLEHSHSASSANAGSHNHTGTATSAGSHSHNVGGSSFTAGGGGSAVYDSGSSSTRTSSVGGAHSHPLSINNGGVHNHTITVSDSGGAEARPRNMGITYLMRIA